VPGVPNHSPEAAMNHLAYFLIQCDDVEHAKRFYQAVFGWHMKYDGRA
jgi:predicted enzyme related to lactoylglutathione lyase